jgi:hypothetical protein
MPQSKKCDGAEKANGGFKHGVRDERNLRIQAVIEKSNDAQPRTSSPLPRPFATVGQAPGFFFVSWRLCVIPFSGSEFLHTRLHQERPGLIACFHNGLTQRHKEGSILIRLPQSEQASS